MLTAFPPLDRHYLGLIGLIHLYFLFFSLPELSPLPFTSERYIAFSVKNPNLLWMKNVVVVCERGTYESGILLCSILTNHCNTLAWDHAQNFTRAIGNTGSQVLFRITYGCLWRRCLTFHQEAGQDLSAMAATDSA